MRAFAVRHQTRERLRKVAGHACEVLLIAATVGRSTGGGLREKSLSGRRGTRCEFSRGSDRERKRRRAMPDRIDLHE